MTSWLNSAEVTQVVEKVREIYNTWPHCWGPREQRHICAVSHGAQVSCLLWPFLSLSVKAALFLSKLIHMTVRVRVRDWQEGLFLTG